MGSYNEGFGRMTAEANMLGIPVIGRNTAGTKEILEQTGGGFLFDSNMQLTICMKKMLKMNDEQSVELMRQPQRIAKELFCTELHIEKIKELYNGII